MEKKFSFWIPKVWRRSMGQLSLHNMLRTSQACTNLSWSIYRFFAFSRWCSILGCCFEQLASALGLCASLIAAHKPCTPLTESPSLTTFCYVRLLSTPLGSNVTSFFEQQKCFSPWSWKLKVKASVGSFSLGVLHSGLTVFFLCLHVIAH